MKGIDPKVKRALEIVNGNISDATSKDIETSIKFLCKKFKVSRKELFKQMKIEKIKSDVHFMHGFK